MSKNTQSYGQAQKGLLHAMVNALSFFISHFLVKKSQFAFLALCFLGTQTMSSPQTTSSSKKKTEIAYIAAGCFWCIQKDMDKVDGVISTEVGYIGGSKDTATYELVSKGGSGHYEALKVEFDPQKLSYSDILDVFWVNHDPFDKKGQFCDKGQQYKAAIFPTSKEQKAAANKSLEKAKKHLDSKGQKETIATVIAEAGSFFPAEPYHQKYYKKNPIRYGFYRQTCGRDRRLKDIWGDLKKLS